MKRCKFYNNFAWQVLLQLSKYIFPLLLIPYLTHVLEPEGYAVYAYIIAYGALIQVFIEYGFNLSGTRYIAHVNSKIEQEQISCDIFYTRLLLSFITLGFTVIISLYINAFKDNFLFVLLIVIASSVKALMPDFIFQGYERLAALTGRFIFYRLLSILPVFFFVKSKEDLCWIPVFDVVGGIIALVWTYYLSEQFFGIRFKISASGKILYYIKNNFPFFISNMSAVSLNGLTTLIIGISSLSFVEVSYWSISLTAVGAVQALFNPLINSLYPHNVKNNDINFVEEIIKYSVPIILILSIVFVFVSEYLMKILAGSSFTDGVWVMQQLSVVIFFSYFSMLFGWPILGARGYARQVATTTVCSSIMCLVLLFIVEVFFGLTMGRLCFIRDVSEIFLAISRFYFCRKYKIIFAR